MVWKSATRLRINENSGSRLWHARASMAGGLGSTASSVFRRWGDGQFDTRICGFARRIDGQEHRRTRLCSCACHRQNSFNASPISRQSAVCRFLGILVHELRSVLSVPE